jgi:N-acetylmuramoyl-L-alanine amidase
MGPHPVPQGPQQLSAPQTKPAITPHPSPNCGARRDRLTPHLVVLHFTAMRSAGAALARMCDPDAQVSSHYLIGRDGTIWQLVDEDMRAWHAGAGCWGGHEDINSRSLGIELDNDGASPFSEPLMAALEPLLAGIMSRWRIPPEGVIAHSDMAPGRKSDPGARFDWPRLALQGLCRPGPVGGARGVADWPAFRAAARQLGYCAPVDDATLLAAVRLRWHPQGRGPLCADDLAALPKG